MHVVGDHITAVEQASSHVFAVAWVTFDHLVVWLEARHRDLLDRVCFVLGFGVGHDRRVGDKGEVDARVRD